MYGVSYPRGGVGGVYTAVRYFILVGAEYAGLDSVSGLGVC